MEFQIDWVEYFMNSQSGDSTEPIEMPFHARGHLRIQIELFRGACACRASEQLKLIFFCSLVVTYMVDEKPTNRWPQGNLPKKYDTYVRNIALYIKFTLRN